MNSKTTYKKALFPGSFDPFHEGHYQILLKANALFSEVIVLVANNEQKNSNAILKRYEQVKQFLATKQLTNLVIYSEDTFTVDIAREHNCVYLIRGLRNSKDLTYELELYKQNKILNPQIETIYFVAEDDYHELASSKLRK